MSVFTSNSEAETKQIAASLMKSRLPHLETRAVVFAVTGELAAGKTRFAKGIAEALGIVSPLPSPSYVLQREYTHAGVTLYHLDCWRVQTIDPAQLGFPQILAPNRVFVIEWPTPLLEVLKNSSADVVSVQIDHKSETERVIAIS